MAELLDERGYEIRLVSEPEADMRLMYLGAVRTEHPALTFPEDPFVKSRIEHRDIRGSFSCVVKDKGIRLSGLKLSIRAERDTALKVYAEGELLETVELHKDEDTVFVFDTEGLCLKEKEHIEKVHRVSYAMLSEIDRICKKHGLKYYLAYGGLLGSLRHGEMIPWDDDLDVAMTRKDLEIFKRVAPRELGKDFIYLDCSELGGGAFLDFLCRIIYTKETIPGNVFRKVGGKCRKDIENHLPLDIYILDKASDNMLVHKLHMLLIRIIYGLGMGHRGAYRLAGEYSGRDFITRVSVQLLPMIGRLLPAKFIFRLHDAVSTVFEGRKTKDYFMSNGYLPYVHNRYGVAWFGEGRRVKYGPVEALTPDNTAAVLKKAYYDYFHYPPVDKRRPSHSEENNGVY